MQLIIGNWFSSVFDADCGFVPQIMGKSWKCAAGMSSALPGIFGALDDRESLRAGGGADARSLLPGVRLPELARIN